MPPISPVPATQPTPSKSSQPASPAAAPEPVEPLLSELPEDLRNQIPALTITGSVYASDPRQRLLLINNQVLTQGGQLVAGLTLHEIQPHTAIFSFQQTRFRVRY